MLFRGLLDESWLLSPGATAASFDDVISETPKLKFTGLAQHFALFRLSARLGVAPRQHVGAFQLRQ